MCVCFSVTDTLDALDVLEKVWKISKSYLAILQICKFSSSHADQFRLDLVYNTRMGDVAFVFCSDRVSCENIVFEFACFYLRCLFAMDIYILQLCL